MCLQESVLFEFVVKGSATDAEFLGGFFLVSLSRGKGHQHEFFLNGIQCHPGMNRKMLDCGIGFSGGSNSQWEKIRRQFFSFGHKHRALNNVLQLPHVARPGVTPETAPGLRSDGAHLLLVHGVEMRHEMIGQEADASRTLAKRRHMNVKNVNAIKEVLSEFFLSNRFFQIFIGRRYDPDIGTEVSLATNPAKGFCL